MKEKQRKDFVKYNSTEFGGLFDLYSFLLGNDLLFCKFCFYLMLFDASRAGGGTQHHTSLYWEVKRTS